MNEAHLLAARLAAASQVFPLVRQDDWDHIVHVTAERNTLAVTVTEKGGVKREYHAEL